MPKCSVVEKKKKKSHCKDGIAHKLPLAFLLLLLFDTTTPMLGEDCN